MLLTIFFIELSDLLFIHHFLRLITATSDLSSDVINIGYKSVQHIFHYEMYRGISDYIREMAVTLLRFDFYLMKIAPKGYSKQSS